MLYAVDGLNLTEKLESDVVNSPDEHALSDRDDWCVRLWQINIAAYL